MGRLTTHVLDTARGTPAAGLKVELYRLDDGPTLIRTVETNADGRADGALLDGGEITRGRYELRFHAGDYLRKHFQTLAEPLFLDIIPIRFGIADQGAHYHVPLLLSPYGFSTYRGS